MQKLFDKIDSREKEEGIIMELENDRQAATASTDMLKQQLNEHLGSLPENAKRAVAAHLTPEFAQLVGAITGSSQLADVLGEMADPNLALVPVPREVAQQLLEQVQGQAPQAGAPAQPAPDQMTATAGPAGPMGAQQATRTRPLHNYFRVSPQATLQLKQTPNTKDTIKMTKERVNLADSHGPLAALRAAKGAAAERYMISTTDPKDTMSTGPATTTNDNIDEDTPAGGFAPSPRSATDTGGQTNTHQDPSDNSGKPANSNGETDWQKRYSDQQRYVQELKDQIKGLEEAGTKKTVEFPKTDEELEIWKKTKPEEYDSILTLIRKESQGVASELHKALDELNSVKRQTRNTELFGQVLKSHPDAGEIKKSEKWRDWFNAQSKAVRALIESENADDIIRGINIYKLDVGITTKTSSTGKDDSAAYFVDTRSSGNPVPTGPKVWKESEVRGMREELYSKYREEIKAAKREGRYDYNN